MSKHTFSFDYKVPQDQITKILTGIEVHTTIKVDCIGHLENNEPKVKITGLHFIDEDMVYIKNNCVTIRAIEEQSIVEFNNRFNNAFPVDLTVVQMAEEYSILNIDPKKQHLN